MTRGGHRVVVADEEEGRTAPAKIYHNHSENSRNVNVWKTLTLTILLVLFVKGMIEIKKPFTGSPGNNPLATKVEFKHPHPHSALVPLSVTSNNTAAVDDTINSGENAEKNADTIQEEEKSFEKISTATTAATTAEDIDSDERPKEKIDDVGSVVTPNIDDLAAPTTSRMTNRHIYKQRGQPISDDNEKNMIDKWGSWTLVDNKKRPTEDYYASYPNRDIPRSEFPDNAWQTDNDYLAEFLPEAIKLVERTQEAILAEYGQTEGSWKERAEMFELEMFESLEKSSGYIIEKPEWRKDVEGERGGWSTFKSMEGLKRRLMHAIMTEDSFIFAMGGHSAAAGHGNNFIQSYTVQVQWILEAIFARLGVRHVSKNFANGGLGTIQHGLAASSVYGPSIDMLMWDSGKSRLITSSVFFLFVCLVCYEYKKN